MPSNHGLLHLWRVWGIYFTVTYSEKLKTPEWVSFRRGFIQKNGCKCAECRESADDVTLQVHHVTYLRGVEPWDYPDDLLIVLCDKCHMDRQVHDEEAAAEFARVRARLTSWQVYELSKQIRDWNGRGQSWSPKFWDSFASLIDAGKKARR